MPETQNIEYKSSWHDDYLKWICGFANAQGGRIYIGKNDVGNVIGVEDYKKLMDEIPNKIKNNVGITCKAAGLPTPEMNEKEGGFIITLFKDNLAEEQLVKLGLNPRQVKAVFYVKEKGKITNKEYQEINQISNRTATYELKELVENFNVLKMSGAGVGTFYELL